MSKLGSSRLLTERPVLYSVCGHYRPHTRTARQFRHVFDLLQYSLLWQTTLTSVPPGGGGVHFARGLETYNNMDAQNLYRQASSSDTAGETLQSGPRQIEIFIREPYYECRPLRKPMLKILKNFWIKDVYNFEFNGFFTMINLTNLFHDTLNGFYLLS